MCYICQPLRLKLIIKSMKLHIREQVKVLLAQEGLMLKDLAKMISEKTGKNCAPNSLSQRLTRGSMSYKDVLLIADLLGYEIEFKKNKVNYN